MRGIIATLSCLCMIAAAAPASAQQAVKLNQTNAWGSFSFVEGNAKVCYVLSVPTVKKPDTLDHGKVFFMIMQRGGETVAYEPQFRAGYQLGAGSKVTVTIGDKNFTMSQLDSPGDSAWLENPADEAQLIAAMRGGSTMQVKAVSGRGNATNYDFSLQGITAELNAIRNCR